MNAIKKGGLGRGLNALFEDEETPAFAGAPASSPVAQQTQSSDAAPSGPRKTLPIAALKPGQFQPRHDFDEATVKGLSDSIKQHGILTPLLVRELKNSKGTYEIIAGERRWRAAQMAQLHEVPVIIKQIDDEAAAEIALIDNLQREDLNPIDEAEAYQRLMEEFAHTQEKLAHAVGKSRSHVANMVRLLTLPESVRRKVRLGDLTAGHARALITARDPEALMKQVLDRGLSVRETERLASELGGSEKTKAKKLLQTKDVDTVQLERDMSAELKVKVAIDMSTAADGSGKMTLKFDDMDQLDKLIKLLRR